VTELAFVFLKLGVTGFGGPAAHIALMKEEFVGRRKWLTEAEFLELLAAANLIPGPTSTELALHIGHKRAGWPGLLVAGLCFILPAALLVEILAALYARFGALPALASVRNCVQPVVLAVVAQAVLGLVKPAVKSRWLAALGGLALVAALFGLSPLTVLFGAGALAALAHGRTRTRETLIVLDAMLTLALVPTLLTRLPTGTSALGTLLTFLKLGSVTYGSGYVLLPFLREALPTLPDHQLLDAVAIGQVTPGPVFTTATFLGHLQSGLTGAVIATIAIFLPAFLFVGLSAPRLSTWRTSLALAAFLDGAGVGALALMAATLWPLGQAALTGPLPVGLLVISAVLLWHKVSSAWLLVGAALLGLLLPRLPT
jgi:chromate transporter